MSLKSKRKFLTEPILGRRNFIQYSGMITGAFMVPPLLGKFGMAQSIDHAAPSFWYQKPLRIMHTVLRETDAINYDADAVISYLKKDGCNALCVNAGGIVDFFQNPLLAANINAFMGDRDILKEIATACNENGIKVIARIDFRGVEKHIYKKFPDWFMKDASQAPVRTTYTKPVLYESCYLGYYRNEYMNEYVSFLMKNYPLDGIWHNSPGFNGICYCPRCQQGYKMATGKEIPSTGLSPRSDLDEYMVWKAAMADRCMERIKKTIKSFGEDKVYTAEVFSMYRVGGEINTGIDLNSARRYFDILVSVAFLTGNGSGEMFPYESFNYGNTIIKFLKSMVPEREAVVMYGGNGTTHRLVIDPPIDLKVWLWEILSAGGRFWNCYFSNVPTLTNDNRNAFNESEIYNFVKKNEEILEQHIPVANVGIYYSRATRLLYKKSTTEEDIFGNGIKGIVTVLLEGHVSYDFILDDQVSSKRLDKYALIILPDVRYVSEKEIEVLKTFVQSGGRLIATYATSLYTADGKKRQDYGLSELFGVHYGGKEVNTKRDNYQYILDKTHPIVKADSPNTELLFNAGYTVLSKPEKETKVICTWVPTIQNQPPDKSWVKSFSTEYPTIVENQYGKGKVLYFANQPDVLSYEIGHPDPRNLLLRGIRYLVGNVIPIECTAPSSVHIGLTESLIKPGQYILSLVNTSSGPTRPIRELIPVYDIRIRVQLAGKVVKSYKILRSQGESEIQTNGNSLSLKISKLEDFYSLYIQMAV